MSVSAGVQLPDQPAAGDVIEIGLGGNGLYAPHSCHDVIIQLASDASGGTNIVHITTDPRWVSVFAYARLSVSSAAADKEFFMDIISGAGNPVIGGPSCSGVIDSTLGNAANTSTWIPPAIMGTSNQLTASPNLPMRLKAVIANVNGETLNLSARVYNFHKQALQRTPLSILVAHLPRAASLT